MRTWAEQQAYEHTIRLKWLKELQGQDVQCGADLAKIVGIERGQLYKMAKRFGVELPTLGSLHRAERAKAAEMKARKETEQKRFMEERQRRAIAAMQLLKRKRALMKRGYTEQQALRILANELGVAA